MKFSINNFTIKLIEYFNGITTQFILNKVINRVIFNKITIFILIKFVFYNFQ